MDKFFEFVRTDFAHVAPILLIGGFGVAIIFERTKALFWTYSMGNTQHFFDKIRDLVLADRIAEAIALCDRYRSKPIANVARQGLLHAHQPENLVEDSLEIAVSDANAKIQKRTGFLSMVANVSTLLGLFGTILGLIHSFEAMGSVNAQQRSALLAAGISTAMNATMLGLGVAIPCMVAYSFLMNRTNRLSTDLEQTAVRTMNILRQRYYTAEAAATGAKQNGHGDRAA